MEAQARLTRGDILGRVRIDADGCWLWLAKSRVNGYGVCRGTTAHRVVYESLVGPIPGGLQLDHLCRVRECVNPEHLEPVTARENLLRGDTLTARRAAQTHCVRGHEFTPENTRVRKNGTRNCRACQHEDYVSRRDSGAFGRCAECGAVLGKHAALCWPCRRLARKRTHG